MSQNDYEAAIAEFLRRKGVTRCPTACVVQTRASVSDMDRLALRRHDADREAARIEKSRNYREMLTGRPAGIAA